MRWTMKRGSYNEREDFRQMLVKVLLDDGYDRSIVPFTVTDERTLVINFDPGMHPGRYSLHALLLKGARIEDRGYVYNQKAVRSEIQDVFCVTDLDDRLTSDPVILPIETTVNVMGNDGLNAYELAVLTNKTTLSLKDWVTNLDEMNMREQEIAQQEEQRKMSEALRVNSEAQREGKEVARENAETVRQGNETRREADEAARRHSESIRELSEEERAEAENARKETETRRVTAEQSRVTAETGRDTSERARVAAENTRSTEEGKRKTAENARVTAEAGRTTAETQRQSAESERVAAENERKIQEEARNNGYAAAEQERNNQYLAAEALRNKAASDQRASEGEAFEGMVCEQTATFEEKEAARDAANQAALDAADKLAEQDAKLSELEEKVGKEDKGISYFTASNKKSANIQFKSDIDVEILLSLNAPDKAIRKVVCYGNSFTLLRDYNYDDTVNRYIIVPAGTVLIQVQTTVVGTGEEILNWSYVTKSVLADIEFNKLAISENKKRISSAETSISNIITDTALSISAGGYRASFNIVEITENTPCILVINGTDKISTVNFVDKAQTGYYNSLGKIIDKSISIVECVIPQGCSYIQLDTDSSLDNNMSFNVKILRACIDSSIELLNNHVKQVKDTHYVASAEGANYIVPDLKLMAGNRYKIKVWTNKPIICTQFSVITPIGTINNKDSITEYDGTPIEFEDDVVEDLSGYIRVWITNNKNKGTLVYASVQKIGDAHGFYPINTYQSRIASLKRSAMGRNGSPESSYKPLCLLHYSDIHNRVREQNLLFNFYDTYKSYIDDVLLTGDIAGNDWTDWTDSFYGHKIFRSVLKVIGNHDVYNYNNSAIEAGKKYSDPDYYAPDSAKYDRYFDGIETWGVVQPSNNSVNKRCYYYKDYSISKIRLIVLDCMNFTDDQSLWFSSVLAGARSNNLSVIVAQHIPNVNLNTEVIEYLTAFNALDYKGSGEHVGGEYINAVSSFIDAGGEFICWLFGHQHSDHCGKIKADERQLYIIVGSASIINYSDTERIKGTKSEILLNLVSLDTYTKTISVLRIGSDYDRYNRHREAMTINYSTGNIIHTS